MVSPPDGTGVLAVLTGLSSRRCFSVVSLCALNTRKIAHGFNLLYVPRTRSASTEHRGVIFQGGCERHRGEVSGVECGTMDGVLGPSGNRFGWNRRNDAYATLFSRRAKCARA